MAIERHSKKRSAMLALLRSTDVHPCAEWVYSQLRPAFPDLSLGTVYRNLRQLTEESLIRSIGVIDGQERFDGRVSEHAHFICERCGSVLDVELSGDPPELTVPIDGALVTSRELKLRGLCPRCRGNEDMRAHY